MLSLDYTKHMFGIGDNMGYSSPILFIELVGFYAGCENHGLNTPLAVIKDGVCLDVSPAAYRSGVRLNMTRRQAALTCPSLAFAGYCEGRYATPSSHFLEALYKHSPLVEPIGYHRAFIGLPEPGGGVDSVDSILREIMAELPGIAFMALAGVGKSKLVARAAVMISAATTTAATTTAATATGTATDIAATGMATATQPETDPGIASTAIVTAAGTAAGIELRLTRVESEKEFLEHLPVSFLWKAPENVRRKLEALGIRTAGGLSKIPRLEIVKQFGQAGHELSRLAAGMDDDPVKPAYPPPEITVHAAFEGGADSMDIVEKWLEAVCVQLNEELRAMGCAAGRLHLGVTLVNGHKLAASRIFPYRRCSAGALKTGAWACLSKMTIPSPIEQMTVTAGNMGKIQNIQARLLPDQRQIRPADYLPLNQQSVLPLEQAISALGCKYKEDIIFRGGDLKPSRREAMLSIWDPVRISRESHADPCG